MGGEEGRTVREGGRDERGEREEEWRVGGRRIITN